MRIVFARQISRMVPGAALPGVAEVLAQPVGVVPLEQLQQRRTYIRPLLHSCCDEHLGVADAFPATRGKGASG
jgi:hypothetical protein